MLRSLIAALALSVLPAAAQVCPSREAIDAGPAGLPTQPQSFCAVRFASADPRRLVALVREPTAVYPYFAHPYAWDGAAWSTIPGAPSDLSGPMQVFDAGAGQSLYITGFSALYRYDGASWFIVPPPLLSGQPLRAPGAMTIFDPDGDGPASPMLAALFIVGGAQYVCFGFDGNAWTQLGAPRTTYSSIFAQGLCALDPDGPGPIPPQLYAYIDIQYEYIPYHFVSLFEFVRYQGGTWSPIIVPGTTADGFTDLRLYDPGAPVPPRLIAVGNAPVNGLIDGIVSYDGTTWSSLGNGPGAVVQAITVFDADGSGHPVLVARTTASPPQGNALMTWNGSAWSPFPGPASASPYQPICAFQEDNSGRQSFAASAIDQIAGVPVSNFVLWRQDHWGPPAPRPVGNIRALDFFNDGSGRRLYAAGSFASIGAAPAHSIARWSGQAWEPLPSGIDGTATTPGPVIACTAVHNDGSGWALYAAGLFDQVAGQPTFGIARWNGASWSRVGQLGINGTVLALAVHDPDGPGPLPAMLYAGGEFTSADATPAHNLAVWDGSSWSQPFGGVDGQVRALLSFDDGSGPALYVGGEPMTPGGQAPSPIAKLGPGGWQPVAAAGSGAGYFNALCTYNDGTGQRLYAAGFVPLTSSTTTLMRLDPGGWTNALNFQPYDEAGSAVRSVNENGTRALYLGTTRRLYRKAGGAWDTIGEYNIYRRVWAVTPTFDDGSGSAAYIADGAYEYDPTSLGRVQRIRFCPACYANCDASTVPPVLNVNDFTCFLNKFAAGDPYANCDGSATPPTLNILDFTCFLNRFAAGCP